MNYTNYIGIVRNNLCNVLTTLKDNEEKIKKLRESLENLEMVQWVDKPLSAGVTEAELYFEIEFYEISNGAYGKELNRLVAIILDKPVGV